MIHGLLVLVIGLALIGLTGIAFLFFISSIREKENRAAVFGGLQFLILFGLLVLFFIIREAGFYETALGLALLLGMLAVFAGGTWIFIRKNCANVKALEGTAGVIVGEVKRYDERETVFARDQILQPGTEEYKMFYREHPEWEARDTERRAMGGALGDMGTIDKPHGDANLSAFIASMMMPNYLSRSSMIRPLSLTGKKLDIDPEEATRRVKGFAHRLGADLVGITRLNPLWTYSHRGMAGRHEGEEWGRPLEVKHEYAVVLATEMALDLVQTAPHTAGTIETARNYAMGAIISTGLAQFIANLGYMATAEHMMYYQSLLVPLAVDAGLGELGRHGYLITKKLGPRIRLAAVTTNLPLIPDQPVDIGVHDFCTICEKCSDCCPSGSIPRGVPKEYNGTLRWKLNPETCHDYWAKVGTDCNICMRVCPWSHAKTFSHKAITASVSRNKNSRRFFLFMDDLFYGRKPKPKAAPGWADYKPK